MKKHIAEILEEVNEKPELLAQYKNNAALKLIFEYAFIPEKKFLLPDGTPPYKEDSAPFAMSPTSLLMELRRLYVFLRTDLKPLKREQLFINLLESLHPSEAKIVLALKDQNLPKLYKKVTHKLVSDAGFVPPPVKKEKVKKESQDALSS
jgi:Family of unknown function (DUF6433)